MKKFSSTPPGLCLWGDGYRRFRIRSTDGYYCVAPPALGTRRSGATPQIPQPLRIRSTDGYYCDAPPALGTLPHHFSPIQKDTHPC